MTINRVRVGSVYEFDPCMWDVLDRREYTPAPGDKVRVRKSAHGCPPANTMGHCYVETLDGKFLGLVHCNSLRSLGAPKDY